MSPVEDDAEHLVCIYNEDYQDKDQVMESERMIRQLGILCCMTYKPDIFTHLGIYKGNPWRIRPTLYMSQVRLPDRSRKIKNMVTGHVEEFHKDKDDNEDDSEINQK